MTPEARIRSLQERIRSLYEQRPSLTLELEEAMAWEEAIRLACEERLGHEAPDG